MWGVTALPGLDAGSAFPYTITTGGLLQTLNYVTVAAVGALSFLRLRHTSSAVVGVLALLVTGCTLYSSVYPVPPAPLKYLPYGVTAYLLVGTGGDPRGNALPAPRRRRGPLPPLIVTACSPSSGDGSTA